MKSARAKSIKDAMMRVLNKKGMPFSKGEFRKVKRFYESLSPADKKKFEIV